MHWQTRPRILGSAAERIECRFLIAGTRLPWTHYNQDFGRQLWESVGLKAFVSVAFVILAGGIAVVHVDIDIHLAFVGVGKAGEVGL